MVVCSMFSRGEGGSTLASVSTMDLAPTMHRFWRAVPMLGMLGLGCATAHPADFGVVQAGSSVRRLEFDEAVGRVSTRQAQESSVVVRGLGSILLSRGQPTARVYVLLHGFTDVPTQFEAVGRHLFADGSNVYIPRLPHHGERVGPVRALGRVRADELAAFADSTVDIARGLGDSVIVAGLSAGGAITGWIAQTRGDVSRAVLIAPAIAPGRVSDDDGLVLLAVASRLPE